MSFVIGEIVKLPFCETGVIKSKIEDKDLFEDELFELEIVKPTINRLGEVVKFFGSQIQKFTTENKLGPAEILVQKVDYRSGNRFKQHLEGDVGLDLEVWNPEGDGYILDPLSFTELHTGLKIKVPDNSWGDIRPRSSTNFKRKIMVMHSTIDSGYTGDMFYMVFNPNQHIVVIRNGESVAQLVLVPKFEKIITRYVATMPKTQRGEHGFGYTGGINEK